MPGPASFFDVFEHFDQAVITTARGGRVLSWNAAAAAAFGIAAVDAIGAPLTELLAIEEPAGLEALVRAAIDSRGRWRGEVSLRCAGDRRIAARLTVAETLPPGAEHAVRIWVAGSDAEPRDVTYAAQLRQMATQITLSEERRRREIAEDLHDHLGQGLALVQLRLREMQGNAVFCGLDAQIEEMRTLLDQAIRYTRTLTFEISSPVLYEIGLEAALESLAEQLGRKHRLRVEVRTADALPALREDMRVILFRSVRELLLNVVKHAGATLVTVAIEPAPVGLRISVEDDGRGFDPEGLRGRSGAGDGVGGFGLFSVSERLKLFGGQLELASSPGRGTRVTIEVPCP